MCDTIYIKKGVQKNILGRIKIVCITFLKKNAIATDELLTNKPQSHTVERFPAIKFPILNILYFAI